MTSIRRRTALLAALAAPFAAGRARRRLSHPPDPPDRALRAGRRRRRGRAHHRQARGRQHGPVDRGREQGRRRLDRRHRPGRQGQPDGYTLLLGQSGPISINPAVYKSLPYDPVKELTPVTMTNSYPYVLVINPKLGATTLKEFVALAKAQAGPSTTARPASAPPTT